MLDIAHMLISSAWAQAAETAPPAGAAAHSGVPDLFGPQALVFLVILGIFYFLLIRPQQTKFDKHNAMLKGLQRGDKVVTAGGVIGTISNTEGDDILIVEIANNVLVKVVRSTVTDLATKPKPVEAEKKN